MDCQSKVQLLNVQIGVSQRKDFPLIPSLSALLVIDIQDHVSSNDSNPMQPEDHDHESTYLFQTSLPRVLPCIVELVSTMRSIRDGRGKRQDSADFVAENQGCEVVFTFLQSLTPDCRDISLDYKLSGPKLSSTLPHPGKVASFSTLPPELQPSHSNKGDILVPKTSCSVFQSTNLHYTLSNLKIQQLLICGQLTDQCVMSAVRDAADLGYFVSVVEDACAALSIEDHQRGLLGMKGFARIISTRQALDELTVERQPEILDNFSAKEIGDVPKVSSNQHIAAPDDPSLSIIKASKWKTSLEHNLEGAISALVQALLFANVKFLRFASVDVVNNIRTKAIPIQRIHNALKSSKSRAADVLGDQVSIAKVCMAALPSYADVMIPGTNIDARDVLMVKPDFASMKILPYAKNSAMVFGTLHDQRTGDLSSLCTRGLLNRVVETAKQRMGIGFAVGAELEFCLVKSESVKPGSRPQNELVPVDYSTFAGTTTLNDQADFITDLFENLEKQNIDVEMVHAESAPGQLEVVLTYQTDVMKLADNVVFARETIKACAQKHGMDAMFQPKVYGDQAGNGMHIHMSLRSENSNDPKTNIFPGPSPLTMSDTAESFLEGILTHLKSLVSFTLPSPQSFDRIGPGCWTGHTVGWDIEEKESPMRVCIDPSSRDFTNVEFKLMDSTCNIYLALAAVLWAGYNGIVQEMELRPVMSNGLDSDRLPKTLGESLEFLAQDHILMDLIGGELGKSYIEVKKAEIAHALDKRS